nr:prepilin-type N-terminal cleavage/methylation domain-containing protein [uncultured Neisseria sp.]
MQKNKKHLSLYSCRNGIKGFSLIEFLVAAALSMIVLMAVSSTYFTARNLNNTATSRLTVQQDLRNASNMIVRDARMAGSFGCFNMSAHKAGDVKTDDNNQNSIFKLATAANSALVPVSTETLNISGFTTQNKALIFKYGAVEDTPTAPIVISSCSAIKRDDTAKTNQAAANSLNANAQIGSVSVLKYVVNAYVVGTPTNGQSGLYRFQYDGKTWGNPQLLVRGISTMKMNFIYNTDDSCKTFNKTDNIKNDKAPALIQLTFNDSINAGNDNNIQIYNIDAAVRGGNQCADRTL